MRERVSGTTQEQETWTTGMEHFRGGGSMSVSFVRSGAKERRFRSVLGCAIIRKFGGMSKMALGNVIEVCR